MPDTLNDCAVAVEKLPKKMINNKKINRLQIRLIKRIAGMPLFMVSPVLLV